MERIEKQKKKMKKKKKKKEKKKEPENQAVERENGQELRARTREIGFDVEK